MDDLNEQDIAYYPLDFETLKKGDSIPPARLEQLTEQTRGTDSYNLAVLALRERIVRECRDRGKNFTVAVVKGALRILTDEEAAVYNVRTFRAGFRRSGHSLRRLAKVNTAALSDPQKKEHERTLIVFGKMLQAARSARARTAIELSEHRRGVPGIPGEVKEE
jgi:hypothetical protein